jgi:hypothetical protein
MLKPSSLAVKDSNKPKTGSLCHAFRRKIRARGFEAKALPLYLSLLKFLTFAGIRLSFYFCGSAPFAQASESFPLWVGHKQFTLSTRWHFILLPTHCPQGYCSIHDSVSKSLPSSRAFQLSPPLHPFCFARLGLALPGKCLSLCTLACLSLRRPLIRNQDGVRYPFMATSEYIIYLRGYFLPSSPSTWFNVLAIAQHGHQLIHRLSNLFHSRSTHA